MKKQLLSMLLAVASLASASAGSFTIVFKSGTGTADSSTAYTVSNFLSNGVESGREYIYRCSSTAFSYAGRKDMGLKIASNKNAGYVNLKLKEEATFKATSIVVTATRTKDGAEDFAVNGTKVALATTLEHQTYTIELDGTTPLSELNLTCAKGTPVHVKEITVNFPDHELAPNAPVLDEYSLSGNTLTVTDGSFNVSIDENLALWYRPVYDVAGDPQEPIVPEPAEPVNPDVPEEPTVQAEGEAPVLTPADITEANGWILVGGEGPVRTIKIDNTVVAVDLVTVNDVAVSPMVSVSIFHKSSTTAISSVASDSALPVEYYTLSGIRVANPTPGLYIRRQGTRITKVRIP